MKRFNNFLANSVLVSSMLLCSTSAKAVAFDINVIFGGGLTASQQDIFTDAEEFWEDLLPDYNSSIAAFGAFDGVLDINASGSAIDGAGGVLGSAGPQFGAIRGDGNGLGQGDYLLSTVGSMNFDTADLASLESNGSLFDVILHEMAHVIGFGTLWTQNNLYVNESGQYTGAAALAAYQSEYDAAATFVPVDIISGAGTRNGHWAESFMGSAGNDTDLLTGFINAGSPTTLSLTSLYAFEDLGFVIDDSSLKVAVNVPAPGTFVLMLFGLGLLRHKAKR